MNKLFLLLRPYLQDEAERKAYLFRALGMKVVDRLSLTWKQPANTFIPELLRELLDFGEISAGHSALCAFLEVIHEDVGVDVKNSIKQLVQQIRQELQKAEITGNSFQTTDTLIEQVELLRIFLASPVDVSKERDYVIKVIDEINRTTAPNKGLRLEVVCSEENAFPGYDSEGGQAVLNAQTVNMEEYALFIGIMWNRVGPPTPRAESRIVQEFEQAISAFERKGQPQIWLYFREALKQFSTEGELEERRKVLEFKRKVQCKALTRKYKTPLKFCDEFRSDISLWLNKFPNKTSSTVDSQLGLHRNEIVQRPESPESTEFSLSQESAKPEDNINSNIDDLVIKVRRKRRSSVQKQYGTMRVLDMTQPVGIDKVYTNVNILEKITSRRRMDLSELQQNCNQINFDRFGLGKISEKRVLGIKAVEKYSKLMVLGKPGAGKTTFLKYLTIQCNLGNFQADKIPIFITLKDLAEVEKTITSNGINKKIEYPTLLDYIVSQFGRHNISSKEIKDLLEQGKGLVLLDGLDEVKDEDSKRILKEIKDFSDRFDSNCVVITCRIAAKEYTFEHFTEVEIADFDKDQIHIFTKKWFQVKDPEKIEKFLRKLEGSEPILELATSPLLLTLLCLVFEEKADFPSNRSELYKEGLDILLKKWDAKRNIERAQIYEHLSLQRKEDLLSQIAKLTFERGDYFFKQKELEHYIADYIQNLPEARLDPEALRLDSETILRSIEAQHGLLTERARGIYSFSHLTFHEYFTAREIVFGLQPLEKALNNLSNHLREPRWREVFLLSIGMLRNADYLLGLMKSSIDNIVERDKDLQDFLSWINQKSSIIESFYKPAAIRAFYLAVDLARANSLERTTSNIIHCAKSIATDLIFEDTIDSALENIRELVVELDLDLGSIISPDRTLAFAIDNDITVNKNGDLVLQEAVERQDPIYLTPIEKVKEELDTLEDMCSKLLEIGDQYADSVARIEELKQGYKVLIADIEVIKKEKMEAEQEEIDDLKKTIREFKEDIEANHKEMNDYKEYIEMLKQGFLSLRSEIDINIKNSTIKNKEIFNSVRLNLYPNIENLPDYLEDLQECLETLRGFIAELEAQASQDEFNLDARLDIALSDLLHKLKEQLPDPGFLGKDFEFWWNNQGSIWSEQLRNGVCKIMIDFNNLGHNWQFSYHQMVTLKEYYDSNQLLVDCLNSDCYITRSIREKIETTLLLPMTEIKQRKSSETNVVSH